MKALLLDIEGVIVDDTHSKIQNNLNIDAISNFINSNEFDKFIIYSNAILNKEQSVFWIDVCNNLFNRKFECWDLEFIISKVKDITKMNIETVVDLHDCGFFNKPTFLLTCGLKLSESSIEFTLIDDSFEPCSIKFKNGTAINIIKINDGSMEIVN